MPQTVVHFTDTTGFGGAEQALLNVLAGLDRKRWKSVLAHYPEAGITELLHKARELGVETWAVPPMPEGLQGARRVPKFAWELRKLKPAVFHAHLTWQRACKFGLAAAVLARIPAIIATEQLFVELPVTRSIFLQQRLLALGVDRYIAVSEEVSNRLRLAFNLPPHKLQVIHNCIRPSLFERSASPDKRTAFFGPTERPVVLTPARLDKQKGHNFLLEAATQVPEALFVLAGDGPERNKLEKQVRELGLSERVLFLGHRQDIAELLANCDLFVLPSLYEGLPLSVLEAMAAGKPVIATAVGGTDEAVINGETGLLVPPADPDALAEAIRSILFDPALSKKLATTGQSCVRQEFSAETMVARVTQIYEELLNRREVGR